MGVSKLLALLTWLAQSAPFFCFCFLFCLSKHGVNVVRFEAGDVNDYVESIDFNVMRSIKLRFVRNRGPSATIKKSPTHVNVSV